MMNPRPVSLTDKQIGFVRTAAASLPHNQRDEFLKGVARKLSEKPSDHAVLIAVNITMSRMQRREL
jgi:hypothetical protein